MTKSHKLYNLILPISLPRHQVLLGLKKRGFGVGKYNGFGGKVEPGETLAASAARELHEECGLVCTPAQLQHRAVLLLESRADDALSVLEIHVFVCTEWEGEIVESEEMAPRWFEPEDLPMGQMWEETRVWMTAALELYLPAKEAGDGAGDGGGDGRGGKRHFVHYVEFMGGVNAQTGEWDPWHGMGRSVWEWFEEPVDGWGREKTRAYAEGIRNGAGEWTT